LFLQGRFVFGPYKEGTLSIREPPMPCCHQRHDALRLAVQGGDRKYRHKNPENACLKTGEGVLVGAGRRCSSCWPYLMQPAHSRRRPAQIVIATRKPSCGKRRLASLNRRLAILSPAAA